MFSQIHLRLKSIEDYRISNLLEADALTGILGERKRKIQHNIKRVLYMINILSADILGPLTSSMITVYMPRCHLELV